MARVGSRKPAIGIHTLGVALAALIRKPRRLTAHRGAIARRTLKGPHRPRATMAHENARALLDERSARLLNMSGDEFIRRLKANELPDTPAVRHLSMLVGSSPR
jgi:hypothetical protein